MLLLFLLSLFLMMVVVVIVVVGRWLLFFVVLSVFTGHALRHDNAWLKRVLPGVKTYVAVFFVSPLCFSDRLVTCFN